MDLFGIPPELINSLGPFLPVVLVCLYIMRRLTDSDAKHQKLSDDVQACKERLAKIETQTGHFDSLFQELKTDIQGLRADIKQLLDRRE